MAGGDRARAVRRRRLLPAYRQPAVGPLPYVGAREPGLRRGRAGPRAVRRAHAPSSTSAPAAASCSSPCTTSTRRCGWSASTSPTGRPACPPTSPGPTAIPDGADALLVANEWLDNVPVDVVRADRRRAGGWCSSTRPPAPSGSARRRTTPTATGWTAGGRPGEVGDRAEVGRPRDEAWAAAVAVTAPRRSRWPSTTRTTATTARRPAPSPATAAAARCRRSRTAAATSPATSRWTPAPRRARAPARPTTLLTTQRAALHALGVRRSMPPHELSRTDPAGYLRAAVAGRRGGRAHRPGRPRRLRLAGAGRRRRGCLSS